MEFMVLCPLNKLLRKYLWQLFLFVEAFVFICTPPPHWILLSCSIVNKVYVKKTRMWRHFLTCPPPVDGRGQCAGGLWLADRTSFFLLLVKQLLSEKGRKLRNQYPNRINGMAKRRTDDFVLLHSPSKRLCRSRRLVDVQRRSPSPDGGVNSPSLLVLSASRSRKRSFYSEDFEVQTQEETSVGRKITRASPVLMERMSGCLSDRCRANSSPTCSETWPPADGTPLYTISPKSRDTVSY